MAAPVVTKPSNVVSRRGETITAFKVKVASGEPLTVTKWTNPKIVPPNIAFTITGEEVEIHGEVAVADALGTTTVGVKAHNAEGESAESTFTWEIKEQLPVITKPATKTGLVGKAITPFTVVTTGGTATKIEAAGLPKGITIQETGAKIGEVTGIPTMAGEKTTVKLNAETADAGKAAEVTFAFNITGIPVITPPATQHSSGGESITLTTASATESPTEWKAVNLPEGLWINNSGEIEGRLTQTHSSESEVILKAINADGTGEATFKWFVRCFSNSETQSTWAAAHGWN